ncbi:MAG: endonuclease/exonuclease/phosphatase family protein [Pedobacter sp.]|jgi:endonuclease/exonuclease/phosphatase family metal-dependent hydrolase
MKKNLTFFFILIFGLSNLKAQTLSVMSYNIHIGQNNADQDKLKEIAQYIRESKAEIVGLQEVDSVCNRSGKIDQMKFLAKQTGMYYAYSRHFAFDGGSYGLGILSRYPLEEIRDLRISLSSTAKPETRSLLTADFKKGRNKYTFATIHMDYRDSGSRQIQSNEIVMKFSDNPNPVILTGDFNARPGTKEIETLENAFTDVSKLSGPTYPAVKPLNKIDYIMVNKGRVKQIKLQKADRVDFSDHIPVLSVFKVQR